MSKNEQIKVLANTLEAQVLDCQKTMEKIAGLAKDSNDPQLKYYALTELQTPYFGNNSLLDKVKKLKNYLKDK